MFFGVSASGLKCGGCESAGNESVEAVENAGDARWGCSKWGAYFIEEYSVKIT